MFAFHFLFFPDFSSSPPVSCVEVCFPVTQSVCSVCHMSPVPVCSPASVLLLMSSALHWLVLDLFVALTFVLRVFCHLPFVSFLSFLKLAFLFSYPPACVCCVWDPFCLTSRRSGSPPELAGPPSPGEQWRKKKWFWGNSSWIPASTETQRDQWVIKHNVCSIDIQGDGSIRAGKHLLPLRASVYVLSSELDSQRQNCVHVPIYHNDDRGGGRL